MNNWNTKLPGLHRTQHFHKVKRFDENAAQNVSNFNFLVFKNFYIVTYELQPTEHTTPFQCQYGVYMKSPITNRHFMDARTTLCLWEVDNIQKGGFSKRFVDSKNSVVSDSILLLVEKLYLDDPYHKMFKISSSQ